MWGSGITSLSIIIAARIVISIFIGKYLSSLRKLDHIIAPKEGFEAQL
jgi:hypothetical protein